MLHRFKAPRLGYLDAHILPALLNKENRGSASYGDRLRFRRVFGELYGLESGGEDDQHRGVWNTEK